MHDLFFTKPPFMFVAASALKHRSLPCDEKSRFGAEIIECEKYI